MRYKTKSENSVSIIQRLKEELVRKDKENDALREEIAKLQLVLQKH